VKLRHAVMLLVGNELLSGRTRDANLKALSGTLNRRGLPLLEARVVRDDMTEISLAIRGLLRPGTLVVTTGGLGPTPDDITLNGVAAALELPMVSSGDAVRMLEARYGETGEALSEGLMKQAVLPEGAVPVPNPVGAAPGVVLFAGEVAVICLPGVPGEAVELLPACLDAAGFCEGVLREYYARTWGTREIDLYETLKTVNEPFNCRLAYLPSPGRVDLCFTGTDAREFREKAVSILGSRVYALERDRTLEQVVGGELEFRGLTVATAESCTGGMVSSTLTSVPGASGWFAGGVTAYSNHVKSRVLKVSGELIAARGAVSSHVALAMARGVREILDADCSVAVTGIAGPAGGTPDKPVGTVWIAACAEDRVSCTLRRFGGDRESVRSAAVSCALGQLLEAVRKAK